MPKGRPKKEIDAVSCERLSALITDLIDSGAITSQKELATIIGCTEEHLSAMRHGRKSLTSETAKAICKKFPDVSFGWLMNIDYGKMMRDASDQWSVKTNAFVSHASMIGIRITPPQILSDSGTLSDDFTSQFEAGYKISYDNESASYSLSEFNELVDYCDNLFRFAVRHSIKSKNQ